MAIKPILFNTEMVRATLCDYKTCTRRLIKHNVDAVLNSPYRLRHPEMEDAWLISRLCRAPYDPGDVLYIRETWCELPVNEAGHIRGHSVYYYKADGDLRPEGWRGKWKPSIHMPKEAARIWIKVTDVRVERLQEITIDECIKEGIYPSNCKNCNATFDCDICPDEGYDEVDKFVEVWNSTIKKSDLDRYGWNANPWVWVIEFERCEKPEK